MSAALVIVLLLWGILVLVLLLLLGMMMASQKMHTLQKIEQAIREHRSANKHC